MHLLTTSPRLRFSSKQSTAFSRINDEVEQPKIVISKSWPQLVKRSLIHLAPVSTTVLVLYLNFHGEYIGEDFSGPIKSETLNLLVLQIFAKLHELMIVGSLGIIVLHAVRYQLLFGEGLPYGLVGSGLGFSSLQFFFRKEFLSAARCWLKQKKRRRKLPFLALLVVSGMIATFAGPSSATLLVPKTQIWPSGGTDFYMDGNQDTFWPDDLALGMQNLLQHCDGNNSAVRAVCPAGGFNSLWEHWSQATYGRIQNADLEPYAKGISGSTFHFPVHSPEALIPPRYAMGASRTDEEKRSYTFLVMPHAAPVMVMRQIMTDWWHGIAPNDRKTPSKIDDRQGYSTYFNAISTVRCTGAQNLSVSDTSIKFPSLQWRFDYDDSIDTEIADLSRTPIDHPRFRWVHLPDKFGALSIGGIFESAWQDPSSRAVVACSIQAGWVPAQVTTDKYSFWTGWYPWNVTFGARKPFFNAVAAGAPVGKTNGRIALNDEWLSLLTPQTTVVRKGLNVPNLSTIESIFEVAGLGDKVDVPEGLTLTSVWNRPIAGNATRDKLVEAIVCSVVVDGLSRYGSHLLFQNVTEVANLELANYEKLSEFNNLIASNRNALKQPNIASSDLTTLHINIAITGFSYQRSVAGILATVVLTTHVLLALGHTAWIFRTRESSGCWSLVTELLSLALNSRSSNSQIVNTGAGIGLGNTFGHTVRIRAMSCQKDPAFQQVELVFDEADVNQSSSSRRNSVTEPPSPPSKVSTVNSFGLRTLFDDREAIESTDALIKLRTKAENRTVSVVRPGISYG